MTDFSQQLSAYLDGELDAATTAEVEARLASDPAAQAEMDALMAAEAAIDAQLKDALNIPVPIGLAQKIKAMPMQAELPARRPIWGALAASLVIFALGGVGGYLYQGQNAPPVQTAGWLADIADYHAVYAAQGRHLVEVDASEADHIETWLGNTIGASFTIPDLADLGLTFEGGRLLVANGRPVAQLMYRQADGTVVALCLQSSNRPDGDGTFLAQTLNGFDFVSWSSGGADYVVIGPEGLPDLSQIAETAALEI